MTRRPVSSMSQPWACRRHAHPFARVISTIVQIMTTIPEFVVEEGGASAAEYAVILAVVGSAIVVAVILLGGTIANGINRASNCLSNATNAGC